MEFNDEFMKYSEKDSHHSNHEEDHDADKFDEFAVQSNLNQGVLNLVKTAKRRSQKCINTQKAKLLKEKEQLKSHDYLNKAYIDNMTK